MKQRDIKLLDWWKGTPFVAPFTPLSLSPIAWWDSDPLYMSPTGDFWNDKVGLYGVLPNFYNMGASGGSRPVYNASSLNGKPSFSFDGSARYFSGTEITQWSTTNKFTVWMVGKRGSLTQNDGTLTNFIECLHYSVDENVYGAFGGGSFNSGSVLTTNAYHYIVFIYDGTQGTNPGKLKIKINGVLQTLNFSTTIPPVVTAVGQANMGYNGSAFLQGENLEVGFVNRAITPTETGNLETYLSAKYGL